MRSARSVLQNSSQHDGTSDPADPPRLYRTLVTGAAGAAGLSLLVISICMMLVSYTPEAASPPSPAAPAPSGTTSQDPAGARVPGAQVVRAAAKERGHPYKYGADGPASFDCSGFTKYVYARFGVTLPHNAAAQYRAVTHVAKADMRRGDLLFFHDRDGIYHVGIYAGGKQMWAAENPREDVRKQRIWTGRFLVGRP